MSGIRQIGRWPHINLAVGLVLFLVLAIVPLSLNPLSTFLGTCIVALAYTVMGLGLNIVVGFAGLLDLGYVAFYAFGALTVGWFGSDHFTAINGEKGIHVGVSDFVQNLPGIHLNFILILLAAIIVTAVAGALIGLPTLRLRGDYIAIVTLAFGEIIGRFAQNGDEVKIGEYAFSNGRQAISPTDQINLPFFGELDSLTTIRPYYYFVLALVVVVLFVNFRLRDSRLGRAWIAIREDEVAASSMGIPLVKTKLLAYAVGAAFGGMSGAFLGSFLQSVNGNQFQFGFSIFILSMVILGGLGSIYGVVLGAIALTFVDRLLLPDVINPLGKNLGLDFNVTDINFGIFGFILVLMMVMRPQGLIPERRRKLELADGVTSGEPTMIEARA